MPEGIPGFLRIRVVNRSPLFYFADGFENTAGMTTTWWLSLGTDATGTLNYWTVDAGVPTIAANVATVPAGAQMHGGHLDWTDMTYRCRFKYNSAAGGNYFLVHYVDVNNFIYCVVATNSFQLRKVVAGVDTAVSSTTPALTNNNQYWCEINCAGTTYSGSLFNDSAGAKGTNVAGSNPSGTIADAAVQSGYVGLKAATIALVAGGAFAGVCTVFGTGPDGTQGQAWTPLVTTGEPAFAWSAVSPYAGTKTASIQLANAAGNGAWQQIIRLFVATNATLSGQAKASAGSANVSAGGLTTGNAGTAYALVSGAGAITVNPTVSCNYTGAVGTAYFDALSILNPAYEITIDLKHLHASFMVQAMQPGNPSSSALGSFTITLHPPGSEGYAANKAIYDALDYYLRVEMYESHDGASLGKLVFAGPIMDINKQYGETSSFTLTGVSDLQWANLSRPFPGEALALSYGSGSSVTASYRQARNHFGANEPGWMDTFSPFTGANYISANVPTLTSGTWTGTTDDGLSVASCTTGTGAVLISKSGAAANDNRQSYFVEVTGRLNTNSTSAANAGKFGIGLSKSSAAFNDGTVVWVQAKWNASTSRWDLDLSCQNYTAGAIVGGTQTSSNFLTSVDDPDGFIPITLNWANFGSSGNPSVAVNGQVLLGNATFSPIADFTFANAYPFLFFGTPATGTATVYMSNLVQQYRYSDDRNPNSAVFKSGTIGTPAHSLQNAADSAPTFLEVWSRAATIEGWYWRYTPGAYVIGTRTLGTVDLTTDPGSDHGSDHSVVFDRTVVRNLVSLQLSGNADQFATGIAASGVAGTDGGGIAYWRDPTSITKYGVIDDQALALPAANAAEQRRAARQIISNKTTVGAIGSKGALVLRDPQTVGKWRELDKVLIHDPEMGINNQVSRILSYTFDEGSGTQSIILDQFGAEHIPPRGIVFWIGRNLVSPPLKRLQQGVFQIANKFKNR